MIYARLLVLCLLITCGAVCVCGQNLQPAIEPDSLYLKSIEEELYTALSLNQTAHIIYQDILKHGDSYRKGKRIHMLVDPPTTPLLYLNKERYVFRFGYAPSTLVTNESLKQYILIEYKWPMEVKEYEFRGKMRAISLVNNPHSTLLSHKGLIAINPENKLVIFISGYLLLDNICSTYFPGNKFTDTAMREYVHVRYYNYDPVIENISIKKRECVFYSQVMRKRYRVRFIIETSGGRITYDEIKEIPEKKKRR